MDDFVPNPQFWPQLLAGVMRAVSDAGQEIASQGAANARHARKFEVKPGLDTSGPVAVIKRTGLGPIFEKGTKQRFTRSGAGRGSIQPGDFALTRARDSVLSQGLDLGRYL